MAIGDKEIMKRLLVGLLLVHFCIVEKTLALEDEVCSESQLVTPGSDLIYKCTHKGYITAAEVKSNQRECSFKNINYEIKEDDKNCNEKLKNRISLDQECRNPYNCQYNNYSFIVKNIRSPGKKE